MKKIFPVLIILVILVGFFLWRDQQGPVRGMAGAELLPADTLVYLELNDVSRSGERWRETALYKIWQEPEVQAFMERPLAAISENIGEEMTETPDFTGFEGGWLAVHSFDEELPAAMIGLRLDQNDTEGVRALIADAWQTLRMNYPAGVADVESYRGTEIEMYATPEFEVTAAELNGWYLVSLDRALLEDVLDAVGGGASGPRLAGDPVFRDVMAPLPVEPEGQLFIRLEPILDRLRALTELAGPGLTPGEKEQISGFSAISAATRFEGTKVRDVIYALNATTREPQSLLSGETFKFCSPETVFFYTSVFEIPELAMPELDPTLFDFAGLLDEYFAGLEGLGFGLDDLRFLLGPEMAWQMTWPAADSQPSAMVHFAVRDAARVEDLLGVLRDTTAGEVTWTTIEEDGLSYSMMRTVDNPFLPDMVVVVHDGYLTAGLGLEAVQNAVAHFQRDALDTPLPPALKQARRSVADPNIAFGFADTGLIFDRFYSGVRMWLMFAGAFIPDAGEFVDFRRMPKTDTIVKHLEPAAFSQHTDERGTLLDSTGSVTFMQGAVVITGGIGAAATAMTMQGLGVGGGLPAPGGTPAQDDFTWPDLDPFGEN